VLMLGAGDYGHGGDGADLFVLTDTDSPDALAQITDFDGAQDSLIVYYDAALHPDPVLSLQTTAGSTAVTLLLDGVPVAEINGDPLTLNDITLEAA